jgi:hypothetical protein
MDDLRVSEVKDLIDSFSRADLDLIARNCSSFFCHPLGFIAAVLSRFKDGSCLRLHVWNKKMSHAQRPFWGIHNHQYDLVSKVLRGEMRFDEYKLTDSFISRRVYSVAYKNGTSRLRATSSLVGAIVDRERVVRPGEFNYVPAGSFHAASACTDSGVTITYSSVPVRSNVEVLGEMNGPQSLTFHRSPVTLDDALSWLNADSDANPGRQNPDSHDVEIYRHRLSTYLTRIGV